MTTTSRPQHTIDRLRTRPAWKAFEEHYAKVRNVHLRKLFAEKTRCAECFSLDAVELYFDYSKNRIPNKTAH